MVEKKKLIALKGLTVMKRRSISCEGELMPFSKVARMLMYLKVQQSYYDELVVKSAIILIMARKQIFLISLAEFCRTITSYKSTYFYHK